MCCALPLCKHLMEPNYAIIGESLIFIPACKSNAQLHHFLVLLTYLLQFLILPKPFSNFFMIRNNEQKMRSYICYFIF